MEEAEDEEKTSDRGIYSPRLSQRCETVLDGALLGCCGRWLNARACCFVQQQILFFLVSVPGRRRPAFHFLTNNQHDATYLDAALLLLCISVCLTCFEPASPTVKHKTIISSGIDKGIHAYVEGMTTGNRSSA